MDKKKGSRKTAFTLLLVLVLAVSSVAYTGLMQHPFVKDASAAFPDDWTYFKVCAITDTTSGNYQMKLNISYDGTLDGGENVTCNSNCNTNFSDLRFYEDGNTTELAAWNETQVDSDYIVVWVNVSQQAMTDGKIIMWYGNSNAAPYWDGDTTFIFFDDFESSLDGTKWDTVQGSISTSDGKLEILGTTGTRGLIEATTAISEDAAFHANAAWGSSSLSAIHFCSARASGDWNNRVDIFSHGSSQVTLQTWNDGSKTDTVDTSTNLPSDVTAYNTWAINWLPGTSAEYVADGTIDTHNTNIPTASDDLEMVFYEGSTSGDNIYVDWCFVSKYASTEPSWSSFSDEQTSGGYINNAPSFSGWQPTETTLLQPTANVTINDQDGNSTTVDWYVSTDNATWGSPSRHVATHTANTSDSYTVTEAASKDTTYYIKVTAYDGHDNSTQIWSFNTISLQSSSSSFGWQGEIQSAASVTCSQSIYNSTGSSVAFNWGNFTAAPGDTDVDGGTDKTYIKAEETGGADGQAMVSWTAAYLDDGSGNQIPFSGDNIEYYYGTGATPNDVGSWTNELDGDGTWAVTVPASSTLWVYYQIEEVPRGIPQATYTQTFTWTDTS